MKTVLTLFLALISLNAVALAASPSPASGLPLKWTLSDPELIQNPESAYYDPQSRMIYVSVVAGAPDQKDSQGWLVRMNADGKNAAKWIDGLHAPKGLRIRDQILWLTDIDAVISVDVQLGKVLKRIPIPGAKFLNDTAILSDGSVLVSDTFGSKIYRIKHGKVETFAEGKDLEAPNGLLVQGDDLIVAAWGIPKPDFSTEVPGHLYKLNLKTKKKTLITPKPLGNLDGLEVDDQGNYLVSDWMAGKVYRVSPSGRAELLLSGLEGSADIGLIPGQGREPGILLVPAMKENKLSAYALPKAKPANTPVR